MKAKDAHMNRTATPFWQRDGVRQLVKFCIVGGSSTIVDLGSLKVLLGLANHLPWWLLSAFTFCLGVTNGFIWNRLWTFKHLAGDVKKQYPMFIATNIIGLGLNLLVSKGFLVLLTGHLVHAGGNPPSNLVLTARLGALPIVVLWNFTAAKYLTFRKPKSDIHPS